MARFSYEQSSRLGISAEKGEIETRPEPDTIAGVDVVLGDAFNKIEDGHILQWSSRSGNFEITDISTSANSIPWDDITDIPFDEAGGVPKLEPGPKLPDEFIPDDLTGSTIPWNNITDIPFDEAGGVVKLEPGPKLPDRFIPDDIAGSTTDRCFAINSDEAVHVKLCEENGNLRVRGEDDTEFRDVFVGDVIADQVTGQQFVELSSIKFKENVEAFTKGLDITDDLRPVQYSFLPNGEDDVGLIAEEVEQICPDLVAEDEEGNKGVKYSKLSVILLNALQQTKNEVEELENKVDELQDEMDELRDLVENGHT